MPTIAYRDKTFRAATLETIARAEAVCQEYAAQGFSLTLRQLYYQFVSRGWIPNKDSEYDRLGSIINDARLAGYLDWDYLEDRTRNVRDLAHWESEASIMEAISQQFRYEAWADQPKRVIVMIEKDALVGVIQNVCQQNDVPYFSCRGYVSQSEMWAMAQRFVGWIKNGQQPVILHLGDHDPSGLDMSFDIDTRLTMMVNQDCYNEMPYNEVPGWLTDEYNSFGSDPDQWREALSNDWVDPIFVRRLALNMDQIRQYSPPPNPAKTTDVRYSGYRSKYGVESWELDALSPTVIANLIATGIDENRDAEKWDAAMAKRNKSRKYLKLISDNWAKVETFVNGISA